VDDYSKLIINLALTGVVHTKADAPHLPVTPEEIAEDTKRCYDAGASMVHLHARDAEGAPDYHKEIYAEIVRRVREHCPEIIVCVSTSGRVVNGFAERSECLELADELVPEMASLTLGSLNFPTQASVNDPQMITALLAKMTERRIIPELEVFDCGMIDYAKYLLRRGLLHPPLYFNLFLGSLGTIQAKPHHLTSLVEELPEGATWGATGVGRSQFRINAMAVAMGGHVRVGLEDCAFMDLGKSRPATNLRLVERIVGVARSMGRGIATPDEARKIIGLPAREAAA